MDYAKGFAYFLVCIMMLVNHSNGNSLAKRLRRSPQDYAPDCRCVCTTNEHHEAVCAKSRAYHNHRTFENLCRMECHNGCFQHDGYDMAYSGPCQGEHSQQGSTSVVVIEKSQCNPPPCYCQAGGAPVCTIEERSGLPRRFTSSCHMNCANLEECRTEKRYILDTRASDCY